MEAFVMGDFRHRAHTVWVMAWRMLSTWGEKQKPSIKEAKQVLSVSTVPILSSLQALS